MNNNDFFQKKIIKQNNKEVGKGKGKKVKKERKLPKAKDKEEDYKEEELKEDHKEKMPEYFEASKKLQINNDYELLEKKMKDYETELKNIYEDIIKDLNRKNKDYELQIKYYKEKETNWKKEKEMSEN